MEAMLLAVMKNIAKVKKQYAAIVHQELQ